MQHPPEAAAFFLGEAGKILQNDEPQGLKLKRLWNTLAFLQAHALANGIRHLIGNKVYSGPFKSMQLTQGAMSGAYAPALLGCYEWELHSAFEAAIARPYKNILNIGCSYGYYSTGLALRMMNATVHAFDIDEIARKKCAEMAALNQVADRIKVAGEFKGEDFAAYLPGPTLALVDIEGFEIQLLDPVRYPALQKIDLIVELHDVFDSTISQTIRNRFAASHEIEIIQNRSLLFDLNQIIGPGLYIDPFDQMLLAWENRDGPTPWAVMRQKHYIDQ